VPKGDAGEKEPGSTFAKDEKPELPGGKKFVCAARQKAAGTAEVNLVGDTAEGTGW